MKYFLLFLSALIIFAACQKTPTTTASRENTLRNSKWKLASGTMLVKLPSGKDTSMSFMNLLATCNQDDYLVFDSINTGAVFSGTNKCSASDPDYITFMWQLLNNGNTINFNNALDLFYIDHASIGAPVPDTVSTNPFVVDTLYPAVYTLSNFDTTTITATITSFSTSSFTISYNILSSYVDTTVTHAYLPITHPDTVTYTATYNSF